MPFEHGPVPVPNHLLRALQAIAGIPVLQAIMGRRWRRAARRGPGLRDPVPAQPGVPLSAAHRAFWSHNQVQPCKPARSGPSSAGDGLCADQTLGHPWPVPAGPARAPGGDHRAMPPSAGIERRSPHLDRD